MIQELKLKIKECIENYVLTTYEKTVTAVVEQPKKEEAKAPEQPKAKVKDAIMEALDADLPESYDKVSFNSKVDLLINHFVDMAVQGYGWVGSVA